MVGNFFSFSGEILPYYVIVKSLVSGDWGSENHEYLNIMNCYLPLYEN